jgi:DegV family protein with EDD domain
MRDKVEMYVVVDTLTYLAKGGRVGPVARLAGGLLDVKPILRVKGGVVQSFAQYRTRARALIELEQIAMAKCSGKSGVRIGVMHAVCEDDAKQLAESIKRKLSPDALTIAEIGPAVGAHTGPGAIGLAWYVP